MIDEPDLFLVSTESRAWRGPFRVRLVSPISVGDRTDAHLVDIEPALLGEAFGQTGEISRIVIATRHDGESLDDAADRSVAVHIAILGKSDGTCMTEPPIDVVAWGEVSADLAQFSSLKPRSAP